MGWQGGGGVQRHLVKSAAEVSEVRQILESVCIVRSDEGEGRSGGLDLEDVVAGRD